MALSSNTVEYLPSSRSSSQAETFFDIGDYRFSPKQYIEHWNKSPLWVDLDCSS
jgi:hypothetical protein